MCICINCRHISSCITYHFIKEKHNLSTSTLNMNMDFIPNHNIIQINVKTNNTSNITVLDWDLQECSSFIEKPGSWLFNK